MGIFLRREFIAFIKPSKTKEIVWSWPILSKRTEAQRNEVTFKKLHQLVWLKSDQKLFSRVMINYDFHNNRPRRAFFFLPAVNSFAKVNSKSLDLVVSKESQKNRNWGFQGIAQLKVCRVLCSHHTDSEIVPWIREFREIQGCLAKLSFLPFPKFRIILERYLTTGYFPKA